MSGYCLYQKSYYRQCVNEILIIKSVPSKVQKTPMKNEFFRL